MQIVDKSGNVAAQWVSKQAPHYVKGLNIGETYTLKEAIPASGYTTAKPIQFTVQDTDTNGKTVELQKIPTMYDVPTTVVVHKTDMTGSKEIPGAHLEVLDGSNNAIEKWVSAKTPHTITKLPIGTYTLSETIAPNGYARTTDVKFAVTDTVKPQNVKIQNDCTKVDFSKTDITTGKDLIGAKLQVKDTTGKVLYSWTSDGSTHRIEGISPGNYTLTESSAPAGYVISNSAAFTVNETMDIQSVSMKDDYTKVDINKIDATTGKGLANAHLQVINVNTNHIYTEFDTDGTAHRIERIPAGNYILRETEAPDGYLISKDVPFAVKAISKVQKITMSDDYSKLDIYKLASDDKTPVSNAQLQLFDKNNKMLNEWTTNSKPYRINRLPLGNYRLHEDTVPNGFAKARDIRFTIGNTGKVQKVTMYDARIHGPVTGILAITKNYPFIPLVTCAIGIVVVLTALGVIKKKKKRK